MNASGGLDRARGMRQFVVGTGGAFFTGLGSARANSEVRQNSTFGVLKLTLHPTSYDWRFVPETGRTFSDSGTQACHGSGGSSSDTQPPTAPANLTASATSPTSVNLGWGGSTDNVGVSGYEVFRNGAQIATAAGTTYTDGSATPGTGYTYEVRALDASGNRSPFSNGATVTTPAGGAILTFLPIADARVEEANAGVNFGTSTNIRTDGGSGPDVDTYLTFNVSGVSAPVQGAKLRLYAGSGTADGPAVYTTTPAWTETAITWSARPARTSAARDDKATIAASAWVEFDVTPFVGGNGTFSFNLATTSSDGIDFRSRESTSLRPELVLAVG